MILRTEHLVKQYGKRTVVNDVSIEVKQGEIVGLLGPNGAGKTTLLRSINRLLELNQDVKVSGRVEIDGQDIYARNADLISLRKKQKNA